MNQWEESDALVAEIDELLGVTEPEPAVELTEWTWTPPQISTAKTVAEPITMSSEDVSMFYRFERQLQNLGRRAKERADRREDALYDAIQTGELDASMVPNDPAKVAEDLTFQQEYSNPGFFKRTFLGAKPEPIGQQPSYSIAEAWDDILESEPILPERGVEMTDMSNAARELQQIIPESTVESATKSPAYMTQAESMIGSGITPIDVQQVQAMTANGSEAASSMARQIPMRQLPSIPNEATNLSNNYVSQEMARENMPLDLGDPLDDMDMNAWAEQEFGNSIQPFVDESVPNYDYQVFENAMEADADYELSAIYTSAMDAATAGIANVAELGFWDCLGYIGMGMLEVGGAGAVLISASQLIPMILKLKNPHWDQKEWAQRMRNMELYKEDLQWRLGEEFMMSSSIRGYYIQNPTYVWVKDNGIMGQQDPLNTKNNVQGYKGPMDPLTWSYKVMPGSGLWKRARIITVEGQGAGFKTDNKTGTWAYLKFCDDVCNTDVDASVPSCWFRIGTDGFMLPDDDATKTMCSYYNINLLNAHRPRPDENKTPNKPDPEPVDGFSNWGWGTDFESDLFGNNVSGPNDIDELREKIEDLQSQIEPHSDLWWELEDASLKSIDDRKEIVETIRKAKDFIRNNRPSNTDKPPKPPKPPKSPKRPNRPGRDRRPIRDFNGTAVEPDQTTTVADVIHHVDLPTNIDQGTYNDTARQEIYSNAFQGGNGSVEIDSWWEEDFSGTRRRLPVKITDTVIPDWFMDDPSSSGLLIKPKTTRSSTWSSKPGALYEWVRNTGVWLLEVVSEKPELYNRFAFELEEGDRYKTVKAFQTALKDASDHNFFRLNSRYENLEHVGLQIATGSLEVQNGRPAWVTIRDMNFKEVYNTFLNKAAGTSGKQETRWTMDDWWDNFKSVDDKLLFEGGVKKVCEQVFNTLIGGEVNFGNMSYGFIPLSSRFGQLKLENLNQSHQGGFDGVDLLSRLKDFVRLTQITEAEKFLTSAEKQFKPPPKFAKKNKLPPDVTLVTQNIPAMRETIKVLEQWLQGSAPVEKSFEDAPQPEKANDMLNALDEIQYVAEEGVGEIPKEVEGEQGFNATELPAPEQTFVRRSTRPRKSIGNLNVDQLLEDQLPENLIKEYTSDELLELYTQYKSIISGFMPDGGALDDSNEEYQDVWRTIGPNDPIISDNCYTKFFEEDTNPDHVQLAWPSNRLDRGEVLYLSQGNLSKAAYQYESFNRSPLQNAQQIALAMQIKGIVYRMMTIKYDRNVDYQSILTDTDYQLSRIEDGNMVSNLTLVRSIFGPGKVNWSTEQFPAPFELESIQQLPCRLVIDLKTIIGDGNFQKTMHWCRKMNRYLLEQREKFSQFDKQVDDLSLKEVLRDTPHFIEYETIDEYSKAVEFIKSDVMPKLENPDQETFQWDDIPEPQLFFRVEPSIGNQVMYMAVAITAAAGIYYLSKN